MKSDVDEIALQGIEFWSTVCDEEVDLAIELSEVNLNSGFFSPWILPISCNLSKKKLSLWYSLHRVDAN